MGLFLFYVSGVLGVYQAVVSLGCFRWNAVLSAAALLLFCGVIWAGHMLGRRGRVIWLGAFICLAVFALLFHRQLWQQCRIAWQVIQLWPEVRGQPDLTALLFCFLFLTAVFLYCLSFRWEKGWLFFPVTGCLAAARPLMGGQPDLAAIYLLAFYHLGNRIAVGLEDKEERYSASMRKNISRVKSLTILLSAGLLALCLLAGHGITGSRRESWFQFPLQVEQNIRQALTESRRQMEAQEQAQSAQTGARISRSGQRYSGRDMLAVTVSNQPRDVIYLRQFTGGIYERDYWYPANEADFFNQAASGDSQLTVQLETLWQALPYERAKLLLEQSWPQQSMTVWPYQGQEQLIPYLSAYRGQEQEAWRYDWFPVEEAVEAARQADAWERSQLEQAYETYAQTAYLRVLAERYPKLVGLYQEHPFQDTEEIIDFVTEYLDSNTTYTLTPDMMPPGQEIPEYFLFEGKEGYCVHYATTAVLLFRLYGIPARYVSGYTVPPELFSPLKDGGWQAVIQDYFAHAWAEIYVDGLGWIPVEVTPAQAFEQAGQAAQDSREEERETERPQKETAASEETEQATQEQAQPETTPEQSLPSAQETAEAPAGLSGSEDSSQGGGGFSVLALLQALLYGAAGLAALAAAGYGLARLVLARRRRLLRERKHASVLQLYDWMDEVLRLGGLSWNPQDEMGARADWLAAHVPALSAGRARELLEAVDEAAFAKHPPGGLQRQLAWEAYLAVCRQVYKGLSRPRRWYFRYYKVYD